MKPIYDVHLVWLLYCNIFREQSTEYLRKLNVISIGAELAGAAGMHLHYLEHFGASGYYVKENI